MNVAWKTALGAAPLLLAAACSHDNARTETSQFTTMVPVVQPAAAEPDEKITRFADANKDGKVTRQEAKADPNLARDFDHYDLDRNGILDRGEFARLEANAREAKADDTRAATTTETVTTYEFRGHPVQAGPGQSLNRTGERGP